jgi:hypothetical protein
MNDRVRVIAVDVGSVRARPPRFGWAGIDVSGTTRSKPFPSTSDGTNNPLTVAESIVAGLNNGMLVALGMESPLVIPVPAEWEDLGRSRAIDGGRAWSAGAGIAVMGTGLVQLAWICRQVAQQHPGVATTNEASWSPDTPLLIWEAFVSGAAKAPAGPNGHHEDALAAVEAFLDPKRQPAQDALGKAEPFNLAATAALRAGLLLDPGELSAPMTIIKAADR